MKSGVDLYYKIDGKRVRPDQFADSLINQMRQQVAEAIAESIEGVECPEHGESPTVIVSDGDGDTLKFEFEACCDQLVELTEHQLASDLQ